MTNEDPTRNLLDQLSADAPAIRMRSRFEQLIDKPPRRSPRRLAWTALAAASILVIAGLLLVRGHEPAHPSSGTSAGAIVDLLGSGSTFERLRGVNAAAEEPNASQVLSLALLERLEHDESVNVRLAALAALLDRGASGLDSDRLARALLGQETAIVQAHLGYRLRRLQVLSKNDLMRTLDQPGIFSDGRDVLIQLEES